MISSAQKDTRPPPPAPKKAKEKRLPAPALCVCVLGIIMACVGDLWDADTYVVVESTGDFPTNPDRPGSAVQGLVWGSFLSTVLFFSPVPQWAA